MNTTRPCAGYAIGIGPAPHQNQRGALPTGCEFAATHKRHIGALESYKRLKESELKEKRAELARLEAKRKRPNLTHQQAAARLREVERIMQADRRRDTQRRRSVLSLDGPVMQTILIK